MPSPQALSLILLPLLLSSPSTAAPSAPNATGTITCPIIFDGRIPASLTPTDFDTSGSGSPFGPDYVKGANLKWSDILLFPTGLPSARFDNASYKPVEVTISDASIFQNQNGFRRAGLQFNGDSNTGSPGYTGVKTLHWSVRQDPQRALNLSHEYLNVWHESADYSADQIMFEAGTILGQTSLPRSNFKFFDRNMKQVWTTPIDFTDWQNFAVTLDLNKNTVRIYYSQGSAPLTAVTSAVAANLAGDGEFQIGILKKPTGTTDVVNSGYQEKGIKEGQIYGSIFIEDSTNGCISL